VVRIKRIDFPMKVLAITNMYPTPEYQSFGCFVKAQVESLRAQGIDVEVLFINGERSKFNYLKGAYDLLIRTMTRKYDLVHAHHGFCGLIARLQFKYPVVVSFTGSDMMGFFQRKLSRFLLRCADASIAKSSKSRDILGNNKVTVIPNGVNLELFRVIDKQKARNQLSLEPLKKYILFLGDPRMDTVKRYDIVEDAYRILKKRYAFEAELLVIYRRPQSEMPLYMNACDVLVFASNWGGSPNAVKEAMACNLPIVSVDVGDTKEIIGDTQNCYICRQDANDIAEKLLKALKENKRSDGRKMISALSSENTAKRIIALYRQVLNHKGAS